MKLSIKLVLLLILHLASCSIISTDQQQQQQSAKCPKIMSFGWGDAVDEQQRCTVDPFGKPINKLAMRLLSSTISGAGRFIKVRARSDDDLAASGQPQRESRVLKPNNEELFDSLLFRTRLHNREYSPAAVGRSDVCNEGCNRLLPESCCPVRTEVAYPQFGQSAISEETFTIIQDFPDFVQPVFKRVCATTNCNIILGNCTQKFVPHAVFSAPSGKFGNLFGQDYLLVESGCECSPYATPASSSQQILQPPPSSGTTSPIPNNNVTVNVAATKT